MEGKASEKLEELGKQYLSHLISNFDSKSIPSPINYIKYKNLN